MRPSQTKIAYYTPVNHVLVMDIDKGIDDLTNPLLQNLKKGGKFEINSKSCMTSNCDLGLMTGAVQFKYH